MDSVDVSESGDLESSVQASLMEAELQGASATRSAVELSLDEDKARQHAPCVALNVLQSPLM